MGDPVWWRGGVIAFGSLALMAIGCVEMGPDSSRPFYVVKEGGLGNGLDLGVDAVAADGRHAYDWVDFADTPGEVSYPESQLEGRVSFVFGINDPTHPLYEDFSRFGAVEIRMTGSFPAWSVAIGVESVSAPYWGACALRPPANDGDGSHTYSIPFEAIRPAYGVADHRFWAPAVLTLTGSIPISLKVEELRITPASASPAACDCLCGAAGCIPGCAEGGP